MSVTDHIQALKQKHADLETELDDESRRPLPDAEVLADLKRQKLAIKDQIAKLSTH
ncbi:MAG: DUF465 domain-containing protein [Rickettsiales bacterium]|jgi:hypothetical protein